MMADSGILVYIGTYTCDVPHGRGKAEGIYLGRYDPASGALTPLGLAARAVNPAFLALDPERRYLYAVGEVGGADGQPHGIVSAFARDPATGALTLLDQQSSHGVGPCHVSVDRTGKLVLVANYRSGSVAALPIRDDGSLREATDVVQHHGSSINPTRQEGPHAHSITPDPENRHALVADLGLDKVMIYRLDPARGKLSPADPPSIDLKPGAGPRHLDFHPSGRFLYVVDELDSTVSAFAYDAERGLANRTGEGTSPFQTISTLPDGFTGENWCADVHVHPSGRYLYASNRGHDSLAVFAIDQGTGRLRRLTTQSTGGQTPRNFAVDPAGRFLLAANQDSDTVVTFRLDEATGHLMPTGHVAASPTPVCIRFVLEWHL
jgi:6-phosphogluconolactonase